MKLSKQLILAVLSVALTACSTSKSLTYLQDLEVGEKYPVAAAPELKVKSGDRLDISVTCKNPQLALPFNVVGGVVNMDLGGSDDTRSSLSSESPKGYLVDAYGDIDFPVLGKLHIGGFTLSQVKDYIADMLIERNYIKDPIVSVNLLNFKITILGETQSEDMEIESNQINILQLIARTRDLTPYALRSDVRVIRSTDDGCREVYSLNLKSKEVFNSPAFYLQQNDIVYVMPKGSKLDGSILTSYTSVATAILSAISTLSVAYMWWNSIPAKQ